MEKSKSMAIAYGVRRNNMKAKGGMAKNYYNGGDVDENQTPSREAEREFVPTPFDEKDEGRKAIIVRAAKGGMIGPQKMVEAIMKKKQGPHLNEGGMACAHGGIVHCDNGCYAEGGEVESNEPGMNSDNDDFLSSEEQDSLPEDTSMRTKRIISKIMSK